MSRTIDQVLADVTKQSDPQRNLILGQINDLPNQQKAQESSLAAQKDQAYTDIVDGARRRGLGFAGIPLGEQAKYNATQYAPAVAANATSFNNQKTSLQSALNDIGRNDYSTAYNIFNTDRAFEEQQRQYNEQMAESKRQAAAAQAASAASYLSQPSGASQAAAKPKANASYGRDSGGGYWFKDGSGKGIGAYAYAQLVGADYNDLIRKMAATGDSGANKYLDARRTYVGKQYATNPQMNEQMLRRYYLW